jgi:deoxyribose-phosphate aldolase
MASTYGCGCVPARSCGYAFRIARQISRNTMAPIVAVIRFPQKSGTTSRRNFSKRKTADDRAHETDGKIV